MHAGTKVALLGFHVVELEHEDLLILDSLLTVLLGAVSVRIVCVRPDHRDLSVAEKLTRLGARAHIQTAVKRPERLISLSCLRKPTKALLALTIGKRTFLGTRLILAFASSSTCQCDLATASDLEQALVVLPNHGSLILPMARRILRLESLVDRSL